MSSFARTKFSRGHFVSWSKPRKSKLKMRVGARSLHPDPDRQPRSSGPVMVWFPLTFVAFSWWLLCRWDMPRDARAGSAGACGTSACGSCGSCCRRGHVAGRLGARALGRATPVGRRVCSSVVVVVRDSRNLGSTRRLHADINDADVSSSESTRSLCGGLHHWRAAGGSSCAHGCHGTP